MCKQQKGFHAVFSLFGEIETVSPSMAGKQG
jgi:hypothetical protein